MKVFLNKALTFKHLIPILCVVAIVVLAFPILTVSATVESAFLGSSSFSESVSGFSALKDAILGIVLFAGPVLLIAMNYIPKLEKHKGLLAIAVPVLCMIVLVIVFLQVKSVTIKASFSSDYASSSVKSLPGVGFILAFIVYILTCVAGAVQYHNVTLDKAGLEKLKAESANLFGAVQEKVSSSVKTVAAAAETAAASHAETTSDSSASAGKQPVKKASNVGRVNEILSLIEKLSQMKDAGVLTEEEFSEKKRQLLEEI